MITIVCVPRLSGLRLGEVGQGHKPRMTGSQIGSADIAR